MTSELDLDGKSLHFEAKGNITIGKIINVHAGGTNNEYNYGSQIPEENEVLEEDGSFISELLPIFMNNREAAAEFLQDIREAKPTDITKRVKLLVKEGTISEEMSHKDLYDILFKYHYYDRTLQNWNSQL